MRENCTSGSVSGGGCNAPTYSASLLPDGSKVVQECPPLGEMSEGAKEAEPSGVVQSDQPGEEGPAEQLAEHAHRKQEGRPRRYPSASAQCDAAARHDHVDVRMMRHRRAPGMEETCARIVVVDDTEHLKYGRSQITGGHPSLLRRSFGFHAAVATMLSVRLRL